MDTAQPALDPSNPSTADWRDVDRQLRALARTRAALDFEEGLWLLAARRTAAFRHAGFASLAEYAERRLGYEPRTTLDRVRVAEALEVLPRTAAALRDGALTFPSVRELTRIAVPETEAEWTAWAAGKTVRDVQSCVAGHRPGDRPGDRPTDPSDPNLRPQVIRLELRPEALALFRETVARVRRDVDPHLTDEDVVMDMCHRVLGGPGDDGRAPYQVVLHQCESCGRVRQEAHGACVDVDAEVAERAVCDAQVIGSAHVGTGRASQTIPPAIRRQVVRRAHGCCEVPGCRNTKWIEVHHLDLRSEGGGHDPDRMGALCGNHHRLFHRGFLWIEGTQATKLVFRHADGTLYGDDAVPEEIEASASAFSALRSLGLGESEARRAVEVARAHVGTRCSSAQLIREALRRRSQARVSAPASCSAA